MSSRYTNKVPCMKFVNRRNIGPDTCISYWGNYFLFFNNWKREIFLLVHMALPILDNHYTYLSHCILKWNFWGHSKTRLDYEFCDNEVWPRHKLTAFLIRAIFCSPIEPILCWIVCQGIHPLGMKMLHIDRALKYKKNRKCQKLYGLREIIIQVPIPNDLNSQFSVLILSFC